MSETSRQARAGAPDEPAPQFDFRAIMAELEQLFSKQLFFIGGAIGSGTTWLQVLLDQHPQISCRGEGHFVTRLVGALKQAIEEYNHFLVDKNVVIYRELGGFPLVDTLEFNTLHVTAMLLLLRKQSLGKSVLAIGEKTPDNVRAFDGLRMGFPTAKFIHIIRDPRDAAVSGWYLGQRTNPAKMAERFGDMPRYFRYYIDVWVKEITNGISFGNRHPQHYMEVRYAALLEHPEAALEPVLRFLGIDASPEILKSCVDGADFQKLSRGRPRGVEDRRSHLRRGIVGDWVNHFDADTAAYFIAKAGPLMEQLGLMR
jgi:hypothetical protein